MRCPVLPQAPDVTSGRPPEELYTTLGEALSLICTSCGRHLPAVAARLRLWRSRIRPGGIDYTTPFALFDGAAFPYLVLQDSLGRGACDED